MVTEYVNIGLTAIGSASITLLFAYFSYRVKIEARFKDLENEIKLLEPLKDLLQQVGLEQAEKVFKGWDK